MSYQRTRSQSTSRKGVLRSRETDLDQVGELTSDRPIDQRQSASAPPALHAGQAVGVSSPVLPPPPPAPPPPPRPPTSLPNEAPKRNMAKYISGADESSVNPTGNSQLASPHSFINQGFSYELHGTHCTRVFFYMQTLASLLFSPRTSRHSGALVSAKIMHGSGAGVDTWRVWVVDTAGMVVRRGERVQRRHKACHLLVHMSLIHLICCAEPVEERRTKNRLPTPPYAGDPSAT